MSALHRGRGLSIAWGHWVVREGEIVHAKERARRQSLKSWSGNCPVVRGKATSGVNYEGSCRALIVCELF